MIESTTIAAISTPPGTGGIGVVRVSGQDALAVAGRVFRAKSGLSPAEMPGYTCALGRVSGPDGDLDDALLTVFRAPRSYTGEDVAELSCHGGGFLLRQVLRLCLDAGAVPATAGEFTKRAFLNGKLDLAQAEAVADLIGAEGRGAAKAALAARDGSVTRAVDEIAAALLEQSAHLAAWADFPEEDLAEPDIPAMTQALRGAAARADAMLASFDAGKILREGVLTAIIGKPNVGKSTLMNLLAGDEKSIVTDIPGTTRDIVEESVRVGEIVLRLADTAGIRETSDPVESIGVSRAKNLVEASGLVLAVFDSADELTADDERLLLLAEGRAAVAILNKTDLPERFDAKKIERSFREVVRISAKTGEGRRELEDAVARVLGMEKLDCSAAVLQSERQRQCLLAARSSLADALGALQNNMLDAANVCIDHALDALLLLVGKRASESVVDEVFRRFCVGK